ncbi:F-box/LRR-repeat protein 12 [Octopus bimaculoides]|uniref:F-box domain-containing protein n=1 Tax=Octopus bimaculoides TaxID=37653 RepID=A0A0L8HX61_OCTBM|nr:F-box/LRR-repeat protein 12 [Octopus bimaculoides]|eukprot:XP_014768662.1 PREDICTED: F-box/LRR-repeat protein 12-like [Octopus bimaculoides]
MVMASEPCLFAWLPDSLILMIFQNLPVKSLCICAAVCRRWKKIANDPVLWRTVDIRSYSCDLKALKILMKAHFQSSLQCLKLQGFRRNSRRPIKWNCKVISNKVLEDLRNKCPNLNNLSLKSVNIHHIDGNKLMPSLIHLTIKSCMWTPNWFCGLQNQIPNLQTLNLSMTTRVDDLDMKDISAFRFLKKLYINYCYRVTDNGLKTVCDNLTHLETFEFSKVSCTDSGIYYIANSLLMLQNVNVAHCTMLSGKSLEELLRKKQSLKWINVSYCTLNPHELELLSQCREDVLVYRQSKLAEFLD